MTEEFEIKLNTLIDSLKTHMIEFNKRAILQESPDPVEEYFEDMKLFKVIGDILDLIKNIDNNYPLPISKEIFES
jgi:hypothetical protein